MAVKRSGQLSLADALVAPGSGGKGRLDRLDGLVKWYRFEKLLKGLRDEARRRRLGGERVDVQAAARRYFVPERYAAELEEALADRPSFRRFLGLSLTEAVPDHTTLCRFRNLLIGAGLLDKLFAELDRQLDKAGVILRRGTMLDATIIEAAAGRPPRDGESSDPDARFAKRQGKPGASFGYKAHVGVDEGSGLIRAVITTPANVNDTTPAAALIRGDAAAVWGAADYHTHARERALKERGVKARLMRRPNKHHPVLPPRLKRLNGLIARRRAAVETTFATLKCRMGLTRLRYRGLAKASAQVLLAAMAFNLRRWVILAT